MNMEVVHNSEDGIDQVLTCYNKSQIDYAWYFLQVYIAYNAWYKEVVCASSDREAINELKKRFVIWDDYCNGRTMRPLTVYLEKLADLTQKEPLPTGLSYWNGEIENSQDWRGLIEYWYRVRCQIVHGSHVRVQYAWLAYETLNIFMSEIIERMNSRRNCSEVRLLRSLADQKASLDGPSKNIARLKNKLFLKYCYAPSVWEVDMQRVPDN